MKQLIIISTIFIYTCSLGQNILIPGEGIKNDSIKVNVSSADQVLRKYGSDYEKTENTNVDSYRYKTLGLSFYIDAFDKNKIITRIFFESPFKAQTENGVILGQTTCKELDAIYPSSGWFTNGDEYFEKIVGGVNYYVHKKRNSKKCDKNEVIFRIEINNQNADGVRNNTNYRYDSVEERENLKRMLSYTRNAPFLSKITDHFKNSLHSFEPKLKQQNNRTLDWDIVQSEMQISIGRSGFDLTCLSKNDTIFYVQMKRKDSILFNYRNRSMLTEFITRHNAFYQTNMDTLNENSFITGEFVYGYACGVVGIPPKKRNELNNLINIKDYKTISEWLRSANPEIQAYGLEGMYELSKSGMKPSAKDVELMEYLVNKTTKLHACSGCISGIDKTYADILSRKDLARLKKQ